MGVEILFMELFLRARASGNARARLAGTRNTPRNYLQSIAAVLTGSSDPQAKKNPENPTLGAAVSALHGSHGINAVMVTRLVRRLQPKQRLCGELPKLLSPPHDGKVL